MSNEDKQSLIEGITLGVVIGIVVFLCAIGDRLSEIKTELENIKREHHVIVQYQYKEPIKDTIYIIKNKPNDWK